jgi:hypothetical protein
MSKYTLIFCRNDFKHNINILNAKIFAMSVIVVTFMLSWSKTSWSDTPTPQYLMFHMFNGLVETNGVFGEILGTSQLMYLAQEISSAFRPSGQVSGRQLGFDWGPIAPDLGAQMAATSIGQGFAVALATNEAVSIHLDDRMFWNAATFANGTLLRTLPETTEWTDWNGDPAPPLSLPWVPNANLAPQMCYESPAVQEWTQYWLLDVVGPAIMAGYQQLVAAGKPELFAGVFAGWESNLAYGYCSLSYLGYGAANPPANFAAAQAVVLQRHISLWAQYLAQAGIPVDRIYTHVSWQSVQPSVAFNPYSQSGWSSYIWPNDFTEIYGAVGAAVWAQAEGSNVVLGPSCPDDACPSPYDWESYLAASFNHGAALVTIYGLFEGETGGYTAAAGIQAVNAYKKFLTGQTLIESQQIP